MCVRNSMNTYTVIDVTYQNAQRTKTRYTQIRLMG